MSTVQPPGKSAAKQPVIGVVRPYAVVSIDADETSLDWVGANPGRQYSLRNREDTSTAGGKGRQWLNSKSSRSTGKNSFTTEAMTPATRVYKAVKQRSLPPPLTLAPSRSHTLAKSNEHLKFVKLPSPHMLLRNDARLSNTFHATDVFAGGPRDRATTIAGGTQSWICREGQNRKIAPEKPPRTLSTFITADEQDELVQLLQGSSKMDSESCQPNKCPTIMQHTVSSAADVATLLENENNHNVHGDNSTIAHVSKSETANSKTDYQVIPFVMKTHSEIMQHLSTSLCKIYLSNTQSMLCNDDLWHINWKDIEVISVEAVCYKGFHLHIESVGTVLEKEMEEVIKLSKYLGQHQNLCLIRGILHSAPSTTLGILSPSDAYLLWDDVTLNFSDTIQPLSSLYSPDAYAELVLTCLVQIYEAVHHLHSNGICHRDIGLENIRTVQFGDNWLVKLANFTFALHHSGHQLHVDTTFVYGYNELEWLGGANSRLPPEVINTPEHAQEVNYTCTDSFASGCLIYEMLGKQNPFEMNPELIYQQYTEADLPTINNGSKYDRHFHRLAGLLLHRDTSKRISARTAMILCETLLWLPEYLWLEEMACNNQIQSYIEVQIATLLCKIAEGKADHISLPNLLKVKFLLTYNTPELMDALSIFRSSSS